MASPPVPYADAAPYSGDSALPNLKPHPKGRGQKRKRDNKRGRKKEKNLNALQPRKPSALTHYIDGELGKAGGMVISGDDKYTGAVYGPGSPREGRSTGQAVEDMNDEFKAMSRSERRSIQRSANQAHGYRNPSRKKKSPAERMQARRERTGNPFRSHDRSASGFKASNSNGAKTGDFALRSESERRERNNHYRYNDLADQHARGSGAVAAVKQRQQDDREYAEMQQPKATTVGNTTTIRLPDGSIATGVRPGAPDTPPEKTPAKTTLRDPGRGESQRQERAGTTMGNNSSGSAPVIRDQKTPTQPSAPPIAPPSTPPAPPQKPSGGITDMKPNPRAGGRFGYQGNTDPAPTGISGSGRFGAGNPASDGVSKPPKRRGGQRDLNPPTPNLKRTPKKGPRNPKPQGPGYTPTPRPSRGRLTF